jgi:acetoin utilization deacetylase AcuC-like enzyme
MKIIYNPVFLEHNTGSCIENKGRLDLIVEAIESGDIRTGDWVCISQEHSFFDFREGLGHDLDYISRIKKLCSRLNPNNMETESIDEEGETFVSYNSFKAAQMALSCAISAAWMTKKLAENTFAIVRPPGHHAYSDKSHGFCVFNNMAVAAEYLARQNERVLVIDIDLHHGDGTQSMLASSNSRRNLHYFSIHQKDTWPFTGYEDGDNVTNVVIEKETYEENYIRIMQENLERLLRSFRPTLIGINAGFDAYHTDDKELVGNTLSLTDKTYKVLLDTIVPVPFFAVLEGGYNPQSVLEGVLAFYEWDKARNAKHEEQLILGSLNE